MPLIFPSNTLSAGGYTVDNSCRFNRGDQPNLSRTLGTPTNSKIWTFSFWYKRNPGTSQMVINSESSKSYMYFVSDLFSIEQYDGSQQYLLKTTRVFRDPSAWYHIVVAMDTTQGTDTNRLKLYVNGTQETVFTTATYPAEDLETNFNSAVAHVISLGGTNALDGYLAEVCLIDGTAYAASDFGEFDEDSPTIWKPKDVSGLTFGNNGFYFDFEDSSNLGNDANGGTDWTVANLAATDSSTDSPTNNFATLNPLAPANISSASEGNLKIVQSSSGGSAISTIGFGSGKWYWEIEIDSQVTYTQLAGVIKESQMEAALLTSFNVGANSGGWSYFLQSNTDNGKAFHNNSASSVYTTVSDGDILSIAVDADNGKIYFGVNGTWVNSGDPAAGSNEVYSGLPTDEIIFPAITNYLGTGSGTPTMLMNFGNPPFSISSGNSDGDGYGNFEYAVPSGFYALCTKNLAEYG